MAYRLRPYSGDVTERKFATEREVFEAVRKRWPESVGTLDVAEDDHKLWVIVWGSRSAVHRDNPVAIVGKDDADPIFDSELWRAMSSCLHKERIDHPPHYNHGGVEVIDAIEAWKLNFHCGNVVKYVARADYKGTPIEDLKKARWYLDREIQRREKAQQ